MVNVIPQLNHRLRTGVLVAQRTKARGAQQEVSAGRGLHPEPAGREHVQEVPARKKQHVSLNGTHSTDHAVRTGGHLVRRLATVSFRQACVN